MNGKSKRHADVVEAAIEPSTPTTKRSRNHQSEVESSRREERNSSETAAAATTRRSEDFIRANDTNPLPRLSFTEPSIQALHPLDDRIRPSGREDIPLQRSELADFCQTFCASPSCDESMCFTKMHFCGICTTRGRSGTATYIDRINFYCGECLDKCYDCLQLCCPKCGVWSREENGHYCKRCLDCRRDINAIVAAQRFKKP